VGYRSQTPARSHSLYCERSSTGIVTVSMVPAPAAVIHESDVLVVVGRSADVERLSKLK
jgi:uncharacterized transporter YbjL